MHASNKMIKQKNDVDKGSSSHAYTYQHDFRVK